MVSVAVILFLSVIFSVAFLLKKKGKKVSSVVIDMQIPNSIFEENNTFWSSWSDMFYNFLEVASNDGTSLTKIAVTPLQDILPNDLA